MKCIKSIGIEIELFLIKRKNVKDQIFNAEKIITEKLGFSIDGKNEQNTSAKLVSPLGIQISTDGTPIEYKGFISSLLSDKSFNRTDRLNFLITYFKETIAQTKKTLLSEFDDFNWSLCYAESERFDFVNPGLTYSSSKIIHNAYSLTSREQEKKYGAAEVSSRTCGLHVHFEFSKPLSQISFEKQCQIIREVDDIYKKYFLENYRSYLFKQISDRDRYQNYGDFRTKIQENGVETLEYRQLIPIMFSDGSLYPFICHVDDIISHII